MTTLGIAGSALAHDGRRMDVQVVGDQLVTQGHITGNNPIDDGNGLVRDYFNAIHSHWGTDPSNRFSSADLPGFDLDNESELIGDELWLELIGVKKWSDAPFGDFATGGHQGAGHANASHGGTAHPNFLPITTGESVLMSFSSRVLAPGVPIQLTDDVGSAGHFDLNYDYLPSDPSSFELAPSDAIYLVEFQLSTSDPAIDPSDTIRVILSPPGSEIDGSHGLSLATETALGTPIPEPATLSVLFAFVPAVLRRRRDH